MACKPPQLISFENQVYTTTTGLSISTICNTGDLVIVLTEGLAISGATSHFIRTKGVLALSGYSFIASSNNQSYSTVSSSFSNKRISHYVYRASDVKVVNFNSDTGTSTNPQSIINSDRPVTVLSAAFGTSPINAQAEFTTITQNSNFIATESWYETNPSNTIVNFSQTSADWITASFSINPTETRITSIEMVASGSTLPSGLQNHDYILRSIYKPNTNTWSSVLPSDWTLLTNSSNLNFGIAGFRYNGSNPSTSFGTSSTEYYSVYRNVHRVDPVANSGITSNAPLTGVNNTGIDLFFRNVRKGGIHYLQFYSPSATAQNYFPLAGTTLENIQSGPSIFGGYFSITESAFTPYRDIQATLTNLQYAQSVLLYPLPEYADQSDNKAVIFGSNIRESGPFQEIASGGVVSGGLLINGISVFKISQISTNGGTSVAGTALEKLSVQNVQSQGGISLAGISDVLNVQNVQSQGGISLAGISDVLNVKNVQSQGGILASGLSDVITSEYVRLICSNLEYMTEGLVPEYVRTTGTLINYLTNGVIDVYGILASGISLIDKTITETSNGSIVLGGISLIDKISTEISNGSIVLNGVALIDKTSTETSNGSIVLGGLVLSDQISTETSNGSIVLNGVTLISKISTETISGSVVVGGLGDFTVDSLPESVRVTDSSLGYITEGSLPESVRVTDSSLGYITEGSLPESVRVTDSSLGYITEGSLPESVINTGTIISYLILLDNFGIAASGLSLIDKITYVFGSGGGVLNGVVAFGVFDEVGSGGGVLNGVAFTGVFDEVGSGGGNVSGESLVVIVTVTGVVDVSQVSIETLETQYLYGDVSQVSIETLQGDVFIPITGGAVLDGSALIELYYNIDFKGGVVLAGQNSNEFLSNHFGSGGLVLAGNNVNDAFIPITGGVVLAGNSVNDAFIPITGGVVLAGQNSNEFLSNHFGSGGVVLGGNNFNDVLSDNCCCHCNCHCCCCHSQNSSNYFGSGGVVLGGNNVNDAFIPITGGVVLAGQNSNEFLSNHFGSGGVLVGNFNEHRTNGGVVLGSSADVSYSTTITEIYPVNDDGYWTASVFNNIDPVVFLGYEPSFGPIKDFFRFRNISIPSNATILNATLTGITGGSSVGNANIRLYLNASDNALAPSNRLEAEIKELTISNTSWVVPSSIIGISRTSPNINAAVQEVITRSGWVSGNALMVIATPITVSGSNFQTFATLENINYPAVQLTITYTSGVIYDVFATGGVLVNGSVQDIFIQFIGQGSVLLSGEAELSNVERYNVSGGVIAGGLSDILVDSSFEILGGGVVVGGETLPSVDLAFFESIGGVVVGGLPEVESGATSIGGVVVGSSALLNIYDYVEEVFDDDGVVVGGSGLLGVQIGVDGLGSGGLIIGGKPRVYLRMRFISSGMSANGPDYGGIIIGYRNEENPTIIDFEFLLDVNCTWGVDKPIIVDTGIYWNTGQLPLYFYRIVGKARYLDQCDPLYGMGDCCKQFIMNISARSINDLCERLRKRRWKWPVKTVERFSRNAETSLINVDDNCDILIPVEICNNVLCEEFCIDYDVKETWGFYSKSQVNAFKNHVSTGEIVISGNAIFTEVADFSFKWVAKNGVVLSGSSRYLSNFAEGSGGIKLGGTAFNQSSSFYYVGGDWPFSKNLNPLDTDQFFENVSDRNWTNPEFIIVDDDIRAIADTTNGQPTKYLVAKNFNARLPANAVIVGIEVTIDRHSTGSVKDNAVYLVVGDAIVSDNMASISTWPIGVDAIKTYGGLGELWRDPDNIDYLGDWDIDDVNNSDFGVAIRVEPTVVQLTSETRVDSIQLKLYWEERNQHLRIGGQPLTISNSYSYFGSGVVLISGAISIPKVGLYFASNGRGDIGPAFSAITMTGNYATSLFFEASGNIDVGGSSQLGGDSIIAGGTAYVNSSNYFYVSDGEITVSNTSKIKLNARYRPKGGISLHGIAGFNNIFSFSSNGSLNISGTSSFRSTAFKHISDGNALFVLGSSIVNFGNIGTLETHIGFNSEVRDFVFVWQETVGVVNDSLPNDLINACRCVEMDLIMPMIHNFAQNNKFSQFLQRNNFNISRVLGLKWSRINDSWITNQTFEGYGTAVPDKELWTLIFQLQCTSNIGGLALDTRVWKFSMQVIQKNLRTFVDYDTRLVISFLPDLLCVNGGFDISMDINIQSKDTILTPAATVYDFKLNDNIGLFKNQYWLLNPILKLQLSQKGIDELIARYPLNI